MFCEIAFPLFNKDVFEFDISVHNLASLLHVTKTSQNMLYNTSRVIFAQSLLLNTVLLHVLFEVKVTELHKYVSAIIGFNGIVELNNVSVFNLLLNFYFPLNRLWPFNLLL